MQTKDVSGANFRRPQRNSAPVIPNIVVLPKIHKNSTGSMTSTIPPRRFAVMPEESTTSYFSSEVDNRGGVQMDGQDGHGETVAGESIPDQAHQEKLSSTLRLSDRNLERGRVRPANNTRRMPDHAVLQRPLKERIPTMPPDDNQEEPAQWYLHTTDQPWWIREGSFCSSCGGTLSSHNSFGNTRRFSSVSIEVPNEKHPSNRPMFAVNPEDLEDDYNTTNDDTPPHTMRPEQWRKAKCKNSNAKLTASTSNETLVKELRQTEKDRNLLRDLMNILYRKSLVAEEVRPYVRHALELCGVDVTSSEEKNDTD